MKICILTERMKLGFGVDLVVDEQARRLVERGFDVSVIVIHADIDLPPRPYQLIVLSRLMPLGNFSSEAWAKHALSRCRADPDLWILSTPPFYDWAKFLDAPVLIVEYGAPPGHFFPLEIGRHLDGMVERRFTETYGNLLPCDAIMSISHSLHQWLPKHAQPYSTVVHLGGDHYPRATKEEAGALRASLGLAPDDCMILWVGRMQLDNDEQPYKGFKDLRALIALANPHADKAKFVLAGRASDADVAKLRDAGFLLLPNLPAEELACAYAAADVLLNLSVWEGFNLALLEAQFQGTPVIAYDFGPHSEIVRDNETGILVKTPKELFQAVVRVANDRVLRERLAAGTEAFAARFTWDASVDKLASIIKRCIDTAPSRAEISALRHGSPVANSPGQMALANEHEISSTKDLLALESWEFVRTARGILQGRGASEEFEAPWLKKLRQGASKREVLLKLSEIAEAQGTYRDFPGLRSYLTFAKCVRMLRRLLGKPEFSGSASASFWLDTQDDVFVVAAYRVFLGRAAGQQEIAAKVEALRCGLSRRAMLVEMRSAEEARSRPLEDPELLQLLEEQGGRGGSALSAAIQRPAAGDVASEWSWRQELIDDLLRFFRPVSASKWFRCNEEDFVRRAYAALLGREAAPSEIAAKAEQLRQGFSRQSMLAEIRFSDEGRSRRLEDRDLRRILLPEILRRRPTPPPRQGSISIAARLQDAGAALMSLVRRPPAREWARMDDEGFLRWASQGLLGRDLDAARADVLLGQIRDGRSRKSVMAELRFSDEGQNRILLDPDLRRELFWDSIARLPPVSWFVSFGPTGDHEPENNDRMMRRIESQQRAQLSKVDALEKAIRNLKEATSASPAINPGSAASEETAPEIADANDDVGGSTGDETSRREQVPPRFAPYSPFTAKSNLGPNHVALVAPGCEIEASAFSRLSEAAQASGADIIFGDELELPGGALHPRLRVNGPFSHDSFLGDPNLGAVIAVRKDLLETSGLSATAALTGRVALRLVSAAHTFEYVPVALAQRTQAAIAGDRPDAEDMKSYIGGIRRDAKLVGEGTKFDIRFPVSTPWKAIIVVVEQCGDMHEPALSSLRSLTPRTQYELAIIRAPGSSSREGGATGEDATASVIATNSPGRSYGQCINEAIAAAPSDCNMIVVMEAGVAPTSPDWLERLAETALCSSVGVVAPVTLYPDHRIRHAGLAFEADGSPGYLARFASFDESPTQPQVVGVERLKRLREVSAVSGHCMALRRSVFADQGAFASDLAKDLADVDFCCRLRSGGLSVLVDGRVVMVQDDPQPRWSRTIARDDLAMFLSRHGISPEVGDPFWRPARTPAARVLQHPTQLPPLEAR